jgi:hypothetical protein
MSDVSILSGTADALFAMTRFETGWYKHPPFGLVRLPSRCYSVVRICLQQLLINTYIYRPYPYAKILARCMLKQT